MRWIIFLAIYASFGLAFGVVFDQPMHSVASGYFWAWTLGWPVIMAMWAMKWVAIFIVVVIVIAALIAWRESR